MKLMLVFASNGQGCVCVGVLWRRGSNHMDAHSHGRASTRKITLAYASASTQMHTEDSPSDSDEVESVSEPGGEE